MPSGPGKYDDLCTKIREEAGATGVILLIGDGKLGSGFSVHGDAFFIASVPAMLREIAGEIERSTQC